jgi:imidazolonepropionase-like amidohydrolase
VKKLIFIVSSILALASSNAALQTTPSEKSLVAGRAYTFTNGQWFDGQTFQRKVFYSVGGVLTEKRPGKVDEAIDLKGGYVVPPFGDAHNHILSGPFNVDSSIRQYLKDGIFYVKNPAAIARDTNQIEDKINKPYSVDAVFANGSLTASGGHPVELYERGGVLSKVKKPGPDGTFENLAYFIIDDESDLQKKWPMVMADRPDFIKTQLLYSEEFEKRRDDPSYLGYRGLNPMLLPSIVALAHKNNLRVSCHIETATDFRNAIAAGVDEIAHMPGYYPDFSPRANKSWFLISERDAALAAFKKIDVVTTVYVSTAELKKPDELKEARRIQIRNLRLLHRAGVKLAIGPDVYGVTSLAEAMNLYDLKVFNSVTLLKMWCETTPIIIFPNRKIGQLKEGYEASFLVLGGNPIDNFENVKDIKVRFKQGHFVLIDDK